MQDKKIDFNSMATNPIQKFSEHIRCHLNEVVNEYLWGILKSDTRNWNQIERLTREIDDLKSYLDQLHCELKITKRKIINKLILLFTLVLVGIIFFPLYLHNQVIINYFYDEFDDKWTRREELINLRFKLVFRSLSTQRLLGAYQSTLNSFGIKPMRSLPYWFLFQLIRYHHFPDLVYLNGLGGVIKNSPFYDLVWLTHQFRVITTCKTVAFDYVRQIGKFRFKRTETLVGYHHENTPFVEKHCGLVYLTNFVNELVFETNSDDFDLNLPLENSDFVRNYRISYKCKNPVRFLEFFTIKAQQDLLTWFNSHSQGVPRFVKAKGYVFICDKTNNDDWFESGSFPLSCLMLNEVLSKEYYPKALRAISLIIKSYWNHLVKFLQLPLLVPGISREWYRIDNHYSIANSGTVSDQFFSSSICYGANLIAKFGESKLIKIMSAKKIVRTPWLMYQNYKCYEKFFITYLSLNTYWSEPCIDCVRVVGKHVGSQTIQVPFERFHFLVEVKVIISLPPLVGGDEVIISTLEPNEFAKTWSESNDEVAKVVNEFGIWTNYPQKLHQILNSQVIVLLNWIRYEVNQTLATAQIYFDQTGTYLILNNGGMFHEANSVYELELMLQDIYEISNLN